LQESSLSPWTRYELLSLPLRRHAFIPETTPEVEVAQLHEPLSRRLF
jgi:hypothetical protein